MFWRRHPVLLERDDGPRPVDGLVVWICVAIGGGQVQDLIDVIVVAVVVAGSQGGFGVGLSVAQCIKFGQIQKFGRIFPVSNDKKTLNHF